MKIKSIVIAFVIFAIIGSVPLFASKDVKKITRREVVSPVQMEEINDIKEMKSISKPAEVNLLYRRF